MAFYLAFQIYNCYLRSKALVPFMNGPYIRRFLMVTMVVITPSTDINEVQHGNHMNEYNTSLEDICFI